MAVSVELNHRLQKKTLDVHTRTHKGHHLEMNVGNYLSNVGRK